MDPYFRDAQLRRKPMLSLPISIAALWFLVPGTTTFKTHEAQIEIDGKGVIVSLTDRKTGKEYIAKSQLSPLLSIHESGTPYHDLVRPSSASFDKHKELFTIQFPTGATAIVKAEPKPAYVKFKLITLTNRGKADNIVWGPIKTSIGQYIGDIIGVVRDEHWAIGLLGLDDNTISGPPVDGDSHGLGYYVHTFDPKKWPVPPDLHEGQWFNLGGDGISDVAFSSHPDEFFQNIDGLGAKLEPEFGSSIAYHSRDRRISYTQTWSLLPGFPRSRPRTQVSDPIPGVDFIGSSVALYACATDKGLETLHKIVEAERLPQPKIDGKWVHDPALQRPDISWNGGPHDRMIEYAEALTLNAVQDEGQGEYYANPVDHWQGKRVGFSGGRSETYKDFTDECRKHGIKYGLHTLCLFLQPGRCSDVTPVASSHLQTVCRTNLAKSLNESDTEIVVTDPSFLAEKGTWPNGDDSNFLQIGTEILQYTAISTTAPWTLTGIKRGVDGTKAQAHKSGDVLAKLQQNCYNGFCPDMSMTEKYADYYASVMTENGMEYIDFDGLESTLYLNQGYYGVRRFIRRFTESFAKLNHGHSPRVMGAGILPGEWEYVGNCNIGGGNNMFDPIENRWGTEGKDVRHSFQNSFLPPTFGIQDWHSDWSLYDAENLEAKSVGWDATYMLGLTQDAVEKSGEKDSIFKAFRAWENARTANAFSSAQKDELKSLTAKYHLEQVGPKSFWLTPVSELRSEANSGNESITIQNPNAAQPLHFALHYHGAPGMIHLILPDGNQMNSERLMREGDFLCVDESGVYQTDSNRKVFASNRSSALKTLPAGNAIFKVSAPHGSKFQFVVWSNGLREKVGR